MSDLGVGSFFNSLPFFTRYWFALSLAFPLLARFGLLNPYYLILEYNAFFKQFQIWRPLTAVFYFPLTPNRAFSYLLNLYFLYNYSLQLETGLFAGRPADYCFLLLFNWATLVCAGLALNVMLLMEPMILSMLYLWCQVNKDTIVSFWFGTRFKAMYLPWVLFGFNFILQGGYNYFPSNVRSGRGVPPATRQPPRAGGYNWGRGHTLGD
ncbi:derlin-1 isoform X2 [Parasteatoda tepidariorum]|uniref:derlin-1 isoform X2 n=1 Tax=Parasteatoda tepidariorum TaxID=114398 RepID=UPI0039BCD7A6